MIWYIIELYILQQIRKVKVYEHDSYNKRTF